MKEQKITTFNYDGHEQLIVNRKLITVLIRFREPHVIPYQHYV
jgi:hypothetical protein